jgi:hypothetical protein
VNDQLSEEEMRQALFGNTGKSEAKAPETQPELPVAPKPASTLARPGSRSMSSKLRVTLKVSREFEGKMEVFTHDASTLSLIVAELEAKQAAKKQKYKYVEVVSIKPV